MQDAFKLFIGNAVTRPKLMAMHSQGRGKMGEEVHHMDIQSHSEQHAIILTLTGRFTENDRRAFKDAIVTAKNAHPRSVIADMTNLLFLESSGVGILMVANRNLKASGISFALVGLPKPVRDSLELMKIPEEIPVVDSVTAALALSNQT